eukprot:31089-Pelagococcus_subviridis.AAC.18
MYCAVPQMVNDRSPVRELHAAVPVQQDVLRLQVAIDVPQAVQVLQRGRDLDREYHRVVPRGQPVEVHSLKQIPARREAVDERAATDALVQPPLLARVLRLADVHELRLPHHLERDDVPGRPLAREVHGPAQPSSQLSEQRVIPRAEVSTRRREVRERAFAEERFRGVRARR